MYLVAVIDWHSRFVLSSALSADRSTPPVNPPSGRERVGTNRFYPARYTELPRLDGDEQEPHSFISCDG